MGTILEDYTKKFGASQAMFERASKVAPGGVHHDVRIQNPFPIFMDHGLGCRKWDIQGNEFIDMGCGHGSLILGHSNPVIIKAVTDEAQKFMHPADPTELDVRWAELVHECTKWTELARFVLSGTEADHLAFRVARAHTGKDVIAKFRGHFHGWHDYNMIEYLPPYEFPMSGGIPKAIAQTMRACKTNDLDAVEAALKQGDVAGFVLEPDGALGGTVPTSVELLKGIRELCTKYGVVLIFDEVITGFRFAPGGATEWFGVTPDIACYAKAICGGVPGGAAVAGKAEFMSDIAVRADADWNRKKRARHMGTFSANVLAAAGGIATLEILKDGKVQDHAAKMADLLKVGFNNAIREAGAAGVLYGTRSTLRLILGDDLPKIYDPVEFPKAVEIDRLLTNVKEPLGTNLYCAQMLEGIDILGKTHGWTNAAWTEADVNEAVARWSRALHRVIAEGYLSGKA